MSDPAVLASARRALAYAGYAVADSPSLPDAALPAWFAPDLVAIRDGKTLVVELKYYREPLPPGYLERAQELAAQHGWEYRLWRDPANPDLPEDEAAPGDRVPQNSARPAPFGKDLHGLIELCAEAEASMRWVRARDIEHDRAKELKEAEAWDLPIDEGRVSLTAIDDSEASLELLGRLAVLGFVDDGDYALMRDALLARNALVHGRPLEETLDVIRHPRLADWPRRLRFTAEKVWDLD